MDSIALGSQELRYELRSVRFESGLDMESARLLRKLRPIIAAQWAANVEGLVYLSKQHTLL